MYLTTRSVASITDFDRLVKQALERIVSICPVGVVSASILLLDMDKKELRIVDAIGADADSRRGLSVSLDQLRASNLSLYVDRVINKGEIFLFEEIQKLPDFLRIGHIKDLPCVTIIPLVIENHVRGLIALNNPQKYYLYPDCVRQFNLHANHIAMAVESALLYKQIQQRVKELTALNNMFQEHLNMRIKTEESYRQLTTRIRAITKEINRFLDNLEKENQLIN